MRATLETGLNGFGRISLPELNRRAALLDRQENKYVAGVETFDAMLDELSRHFDVLDIDGRVLFDYSTVYFDSDCLAAYRAHAQDRRRRFKVRSRHYVDSGLCYVEVKLKGSRDRTIKERLPCEVGEHGSFPAAGQHFVERVYCDVYDVEFPYVLRPQAAMRFRRVTLVGKRGAERVTVDADLRFEDTGGARAAMPRGLVIVEVKSPDGRGAADHIVRGHGLRGESCSKYCLGMNLLRPGLRNNRFRPTLRRYFDWSPAPAA